MSSSLNSIDPRDVGLDADRLDYIPAYFSSYIEKGKLPCMTTLVARRGEIAHLSLAGKTSIGDEGKGVDLDTIYRLYSMTKPVTSVALMMLYEQGLIQLFDPVSKYIPAFADLRVYESGEGDSIVTRQMDRPMLVRDLLNHTSGLSYSFLMQHPVDALYRKQKVDPFSRADGLEGFTDALSQMPLVFSPGTQWNYSVATDVVGRLVEIVSGMRLDQFFQTRIFDPLGMVDTGFSVPSDKADRLMSCYQRDALTGEVSLQDAGGVDSTFTSAPGVLSGGGGLCGTLGDYYRFCCMLANGGTLNGARLLSPKTVEFMTENHLPGGRTISEMGDKTFSEARMEGSGFGLGFAVTTDPVGAMQPGSVGTFSWGGMASTFFWIDPREELIVIQLTQLVPSSSYPIRPQLHQLVYAAIDD